jgi:4-hydroxybenzoyl-CoA reductase alpha subunit
MNMKTNPYNIIGSRATKVDDGPKITGSGVYVFDVNLPGMLYGKILRSPHPHAQIVNIDTSEAWQVRGVRSVITAEDTPKKPFSFVQDLADKLSLCDGRVRYIGDEVAAVAAENVDSANRALEKIKVEYNILPHLDDPVEAMKPDAVKIHEDRENIAFEVHQEFGDVKAALGKADFVFEGTFATQKHHHSCLEPTGGIAQYSADGELTVWSVTQAPHTLKQELSRILDLDQKNIRVIKPLIGGGFGRGLVADMIEPVAAILSMRTKRPVKIIKNRSEDFCTSRTRYPFLVKLKTGVSKEGRILAKQAEVIVDNGAYNDKGPGVVNAAGVVFTTQYDVKNVKYDSYLVYTNKEYGTAFRGFGNTQMQFAFESHLDDIANGLGIDPAKIRLINANKPATKTVTGAAIGSLGMMECIEKACASSKWDTKRNARKEKGIKKRGIGMAVILYTGAGSRYYGYNSSNAHIKVSDRGKVSVITSAVDMGQGSETVMAEIAAETIGVRLDDVRVITEDTDVTPYGLGAFGSRTTFVCGNAVKAAAEKVKNEVVTFATEMLETKKENLVFENGLVRKRDNPEACLSFADVIKYGIYEKGRSIAVSGEYFDALAPEVGLTKGYGIHMPVWVSACYVAEVEVDMESGQTRVMDVWVANDSGRIINKNMAEGQLEGGVVQGIGYALTEELVVNKGKVENPSFVDYKVLGAKDIPRIHSMFVEIDDPDGPFGAKGLGEHPLQGVAPAIANAIYDATGARFVDLPITPDKVLRALE